MIARLQLRKTARGRLSDSDVLFRAKRYDGAFYLCGYAVEIALKARICKTLGWPGFPSSGKEFENFKSFRTHSLDVLLPLSGSERKIKTALMAEWSVVRKWDTQLRYSPIGTMKPEKVKDMLDAATRLLKAL